MDKESLLADRISANTRTVEIEGLGEITVRGLSRHEMIHVFSFNGKRHQQERVALSLAMVDPELTEEEVGVWQRHAPNDEIERVSQIINELNGTATGAAKSVVHEAGERSDD